MGVHRPGHTRLPSQPPPLTVGQRSADSFVDQADQRYRVRYAGPNDLVLL